MPDYTPNLGLTKPKPQEVVDINVINDNYDKVDNFAGNVKVPLFASEQDRDAAYLVKPFEQCYVGPNKNQGTPYIRRNGQWMTQGGGGPGPKGEGVPNGGITGQILTKVSNADQDSDWVFPVAIDLTVSELPPQNPILHTAWIPVISNMSRMYTAVGENGSIYQMPAGGTEWNVIPSGVTENLNCIQWVPSINKLVVVGNKGVVLSSPDGITWSSHSSGITTNLVNFCVGGSGNTLVAVGVGGVILTADTSDLNTWTSRTSGTALDFKKVIWGSGTTSSFCAVTDTTTYSSTDGVNWSLRTTPALGSRLIMDVAFGNDTFVFSTSVVAGLFYRKSNVAAWTLSATIPNVSGSGTTGYYAVGFFQGYFYASAAAGATSLGFATSQDGNTWTAHGAGYVYSTLGFVERAGDNKIVLGYLTATNSSNYSTVDKAYTFSTSGFTNPATASAFGTPFPGVRPNEWVAASYSGSKTTLLYNNDNLSSYFTAYPTSDVSGMSGGQAFQYESVSGKVITCIQNSGKLLYNQTNDYATTTNWLSITSGLSSDLIRTLFSKETGKILLYDGKGAGRLSLFDVTGDAPVLKVNNTVLSTNNLSLNGAQGGDIFPSLNCFVLALANTSVSSEAKNLLKIPYSYPGSGYEIVNLPIANSSILVLKYVPKDNLMYMFARDLTTGIISVFTTGDLANWNTLNTNFSTQYILAFGYSEVLGKYVAIDNGSLYYISEDAIQWRPAVNNVGVPPATSNSYAIFEDKIVAVDSNGSTFYRTGMLKNNSELLVRAGSSNKLIAINDSIVAKGYEKYGSMKVFDGTSWVEVGL